MPTAAEVREGAERCVLDWARVRPGEQVLLLYPSSPFVEPVVIDTFMSVCAAAGATVSRASCAVFNPRVEDAPPPIAKALQGADVCFFFSPFPALLHSKTGKKAMLEYGLRNVPVLANTAELLGSEWARFPVDLLFELHRRSAEIVDRDPRMIVAGRNGTRLTGIAPSVSRVNRHLCTPGLSWHGIWPGECGPCLTPMAECNGDLVMDVLPGFDGFLQQKVHLQLKNCQITAFEGGKEADWFRDFVGENVKRGTDANVLHELQWGVNPKGNVARGVLNCKEDEVEISRCARTVHFGFGSGQKQFHWDVVVVNHFDISNGRGEPIYRDGRLVLLDDPGIRRMAARYGDPDEVLRELSEAAGQ